ncbi:hypothetical protein CHM34_06950 [Paludifilum halophilum]|uniref:Uncharacterized protein n=2 Tax=Paludifilum halophilum TaxID=1642702 RepID=A0A235B9I8_9BACL|nr:hypothetical protein CHM34_06950 [Paludifilum halophilum]
MMTLVLMDNAKVLAFYDEDGAFLGERERTEALHTLFEDAERKLFRLELEEDVEYSTISVEEYDGEYDVVRNDWVYLTNGRKDFRDDNLRTYKREYAAVAFAYKQGLPVSLNY